MTSAEASPARRVARPRCSYSPSCWERAQLRVWLARCADVSCDGHLLCVEHTAGTRHLYSEFLEDR